MPLFIIKEASVRKNKENGAFTWLVCITNNYNKSFFAFQVAMAYCNRSKDRIKGINLYSGQDGHEKKEVEKEFMKLCHSMKLKNCSFEYIEKDRALGVGKQICKIVNYGEEYVDFLVLGHNPAHTNSESNPNFEITKFAQANIMFSSYSNN